MVTTSDPLAGETFEGLLEWQRMTGPEMEAVDRQLPVVVPMGLVEDHGRVLDLNFDNDTAAHFARIACARTGAVLMPTLAYGYPDEFGEYPGTVGIRLETLAAVMADLCCALCGNGFHKVIFLAGHGANQKAAPAAFERAWSQYPDLKPLCVSWWGLAGIEIHHADEVETGFAMVMGSRVRLDHAEGGSFRKPWHAVRSRRALFPNLPPVNGNPLKATPELVRADYERVIEKLCDLLSTASADRPGAPGRTQDL